jgi:peptide/nickel transport system permease protein
VLPLILQRIVATIPVMGVVALTVFALLHLTPGDPAEIIAGDYATPQDIAKIRAGLGLDKPLLTQAGIWLGNVLRGDLGTSIYSGLPVTTLIGQRMGPTVALTVLAMLISVLLAVPLGVLAAWRQGSWIDRSIMVFSVPRACHSVRVGTPAGCGRPRRPVCGGHDGAPTSTGPRLH